MSEKDNKLNIIKGLATFSVCSGHVLDRFVYYRTDYQSTYLKILYKYIPISWLFITAGGIGVIYFCLLSGMFCYKSKIVSFKDFIFKSFKRYINFFSLLLLCNIVMIICSACGFFNSEGNRVLSSNELYPNLPVAKGIVKALRIESWNGAMWMIKYLFFGNIIVYFFCYLKNILSRKWVLFIIYLLMLIGAWYIDPLVAVTVGGVIFSYFFRYGNKILDSITNYSESKKYRTILLIAYILLLNVLTIGIQLPPFLVHYYVFTMPFAFSMILVEYQMIALLGDRVISCLNKVSNYQMAMFCVHIPIIYTFGGWLYGITLDRIKEEMIHIFLVYICIIVFVVVMSFLYESYIEHNRRKMISFIKR